MSASETRHPPVVTIAALYGAAGSVIGPRVAERLAVPFLDRAIPEAVATRTGLSEAAVADVDEVPRTALERFTARLGRASTISARQGAAWSALTSKRARCGSRSRSSSPEPASPGAWRSGHRRAAPEGRGPCTDGLCP